MTNEERHIADMRITELLSTTAAISRALRCEASLHRQGGRPSGKLGPAGERYEGWAQALDYTTTQLASMSRAWLEQDIQFDELAEQFANLVKIHNECQDAYEKHVAALETLNARRFWQRLRDWWR